MTVTPKVPRGSLPTHTARRIIRDFEALGLKPGDGLADEATLVERYGVSRGTLREALRLLSFLGAVAIKAGPHGGPRLVMPKPAVVGSALGMVVQFQGATLRTVFEARLAIEPTVAALAASNGSKADLDRLTRCVASLRAAQGSRGRAYAEHAVAYTLVVAEATHNALLATIVPALAAMTTTVSWRYPRGSRPELTDRVESIVHAIRDGDSDEASAGSRAMMQWLMEGLQAEQPTTLEHRILWPDLDEVLASGLHA